MGSLYCTLVEADFAALGMNVTLAADCLDPGNVDLKDNP